MANIMIQIDMSKLSKKLIEVDLTYLKVGARGNSISIFSEYEGEKENRCRFTKINKDTYTLSMSNRNGKWEATPFEGDIEELLNIVMNDFEWILSDYNLN